MWVKPTNNIIEAIKRGAPNTTYQNASLSCGSSASGDLFCSSLISAGIITTPYIL